MFFVITFFAVILSTKKGTIRPAMVPIPLDMPIKILAYLGAMSRWLTLKPEMAKPLHATPIARATVAAVPFLDVVAWATTRKKSASIPKPPQLKTFRTFVVVIIPRLRRWSANKPPQGTIIVISKCGSDPMTPVCQNIWSLKIFYTFRSWSSVLFSIFIQQCDIPNKTFYSSLFYREIVLLLNLCIYLDKRHVERLVHETRLEKYQQIEVPRSTKISDNDGVYGHWGEKLAPGSRRQCGHRCLRLPLTERILDVT